MRIQKRFTLLCVLALVVISGLFVLAIKRSPPSSQLPSPNGYDDFVEAGRILTESVDGHRNLSDYSEMSVEELRLLTLTNAEPLKIVRRGLDLQCRMPLRYDRDWYSAHTVEMLSFKKLAYTFCIAARLAQLEGRTNDAIKIDLDLIRFAHESTRGGVIIDSAVMRAIEGLSVASLRSLQNSLDAQQCRRIASALEAVVMREPPWYGFSAHDFAYTWHEEFGSFFSLRNWETKGRFRTRFYDAQMLRRQTIIDFASHAYELDKGQLPKSIAELVPDYLKAIPKDPFTGTNMIYKP